MDTIDLRSDTVSWPTPEMREAMASAPVGDDVFGEDPTVNELEAEAAHMLGKEAGLFVASGTMGNLAATLAHCGRGDEMILGKTAHMFRYEAGGSAALGGVHPNTIPVQPDGTLDLNDIRAAIRPLDDHMPRSRLICLENTQAIAGGVPLTAEYIRQVADIARQHDLRLHIDGARFFNAAVALGVPAAELAAPADSISICLSKGLCAPVGSVLVGSREFIHQARRARKILGGGMRQAGILAAAGLIALRVMTRRLGEDHEHARLLAEGLASIPVVRLNPPVVRTNMIFFDLDRSARIPPHEISRRLKVDYNILVEPYSGDGYRFRLLTHYWITRERVETTVRAFRELLL